jgi:phenylalanyl-tRNA synthetase beta chain
VKIAHHTLSRWVDVPEDPRALRSLLDDVGIEVKRAEPHPTLGTAFTLELLANRGDHHGIHGVAREIGGRTGGEVRVPPVAALPSAPCPVVAFVDDPRCFAYSLVLLEGPAGAVLPSDVVAPIEVAGQKSVGAVVDATNLASLELGQPTHAFDADKVTGSVRVRASVEGERAWLLFTPEPVVLPAGTLVICDDVSVLAVAGVIGCEPSKTTAATTRVLLESATFEPVTVRKTARALGVHTDAAARFERGADPSAMITGAGRVVALLDRVGFVARGASITPGPEPLPEPAPIDLSIQGVQRALACPDLSATEIEQRLTRYGYRCTSSGHGRLSVVVPPHRRWDVAFVDDLYEDLARSIGYNELPTSIPRVPHGVSPSPAERRKSRVDAVLVAAGFYEVITDGFYGRATRERLGVTEGHPLWAHVETTNALDRGYSLLKNQALAQAVDAVAVNQRMRTEVVRAFEWTRTFHPDPSAPNGVCTERPLLWVIASGAEVDWAHASREPDAWLMAGLVREISAALGLRLELRPVVDGEPLASLLHPGRSASVVRDGARVGVLGEVHPVVVRSAKIKRARPVYLELDASVLDLPGAPVVFVEPDTYQPAERSLAFTLPIRVTAAEVGATLAASGPSWVRSVTPVDVFHHEEAGAPVRTVTYRIVMNQEDPPRTAESMNAACDAMVRAVASAHGPRGVAQRA